jgi:hypothetical protein
MSQYGYNNKMRRLHNLEDGYRNEYCEYAARAVYIIHVFYMNGIYKLPTESKMNPQKKLEKRTTLSSSNWLARDTKSDGIADGARHLTEAPCLVFRQPQIFCPWRVTDQTI